MFAKPNEVIAQVMPSLPEHSRAVLPAYDTLRKKVNRETRRHLPVEPATAVNVNIPIHLQLTPDGHRFLLFEGNYDENERFIIFATDIGLRRLCQARNWMGDGTFSVVPAIFSQLYILHSKGIPQVPIIIYC
jgi:hypothetical protein